MALLTIGPTELDEDIARAVASHTDRRIERVASTLTWAGDEHVLLTLAAFGWLMTRNAGAPKRQLSTHFLACSIATAIVPHFMKIFIDQERPDRLTVQGRFRGVPFSGKSSDAFPSGHALHIGALASAATMLPPKLRNAVWAAGGVVVTTRIVLLAHWMTDVLAGLAIGACIERAIRQATKPQRIAP